MVLSIRTIWVFTIVYLVLHTYSIINLTRLPDFIEIRS